MAIQPRQVVLNRHSHVQDADLAPPPVCHDWYPTTNNFRSVGFMRQPPRRAGKVDWGAWLSVLVKARSRTGAKRGVQTVRIEIRPPKVSEGKAAAR